MPPDYPAAHSMDTVWFKGLCFSETDLIQPVEHVACKSWEVAYLSVDGKNARPVPGLEEGYRENYPEYIKGETGITFEPPAGGVADQPVEPSRRAKPAGPRGWLRRFLDLFGR